MSSIERASQPMVSIEVGCRPDAGFVERVVGRLVAENSAKRRRPQHRTAGLGAERRRHHVIGDRRRRSARRAAGRMRGIMRIGGFRRRTAGEFASRGLAEDHGAGAAQERDAGGVRARPVAAVNRRTHLGRHIERIDCVLKSDRNAVQRPTALPAIERARLRKREIGVEIHESLHHSVAFGDSRHAIAHHRFAGRLARRDFVRDLGRGKFVERAA